jgi:nitrogen PTS system EIIA component
VHDIMTLEEVADYLRVSERTVSEWAQKGDLPGGKLGTSWRFMRKDVERWVAERISAGNQSPMAPVSAMPATILKPERILILEGHHQKMDILRILADRLIGTGRVGDATIFWQALVDRENLMSTGIGCGIGVPHIRQPSIQDLFMAMAICPDGIPDYISLDEEPVRIVCMLAARTDQHAQYLRMLSFISARLKHAPFRKHLIELNDEHAICAYLLTGEV